jgi:hypothetical protein
VTEAQALKLTGSDQLRDAGLNDRSKYLNEVQVLETHSRIFSHPVVRARLGLGHDRLADP